MSRAKDHRCPECGAPALPVIWGMPAGDPGPAVILAGCVISDDPARWGCKECGWMGNRTGNDVQGSGRHG
jgi:ribosomal protein S27AE